jgi:hypothetical protein
MASTYKRLGAIASTGAVGTPDTLYTASATASTSTVTSTIAICNTSESNATFRLCVSTSAVFQDAGYLVNGTTVSANDTVFLTLGITLDPTNRFLLASASSTSVVFSVFGVENS